MQAEEFVPKHILHISAVSYRLLQKLLRVRISLRTDAFFPVINHVPSTYAFYFNINKSPHKPL